MTATQGNCYICGATLGKVALKNHILKMHNDPAGEQECRLLKIEGANKNFWLLVDIPADETLAEVDAFLRDIWLECCGHMSAFTTPKSWDEIPMERELGQLPVGSVLEHKYDFGSTTHCLLTVLAVIRRPKQSEDVRLLARNVPPQHTCAACGKPADLLCNDCWYDSDDAFYCDACAEDHEHDYMITVANSPRMGVCGYDGDKDDYVFDPAKVQA